jgi:putative nucleotidyltransferase with HDIG domain
MKTSWFQSLRGYLSTNSRGWRVFVGFICVIALALFFHFREVRVEVLELNSTAPRYIVAQVDFEFPDYETTIILKQQAMKDIGQIYQIDDKEIRDVRLDLENQLIQGRKWRLAAPSSTFDEMYKAADILETQLLEARFTDPRTIQKIKDLNLPEEYFHEFLPDDSDTDLPPQFWSRMAGQLGAAEPFQKETIAYVIDTFRQHQWKLIEDRALMHGIRAQVSNAIPERLTRVDAGTRMIDQGEQITSRHLAMMQAMKQAISDSRKLEDPLTIIASLLISLIFVTVSALYFRISDPVFFRSIQKMGLFVCIVILTLAFAKLTEFIILKSSSNIIEGVRYPIVAPFATILICILLSPRTALFAATCLSIILSVSLAVDHSRFLVLNLVTAIVVIISTKGVRKRKEVFTVCIKSWISSIPVLFAYSFSEGTIWSSALGIDICSSLAFLLVTAILVVGLLPALESVFRVLTDMTLMEYMDPNNELLRRLAMEVPGTYQHSLVLGTLSEICAQAVGANGLFCRAATLYHDIGKILNPQYYTENQQGADILHQVLTPTESAHVIISHVVDGEILARKYKLPEPFIDIILEHHGTTLVYFFYRKQLDLKGGRVEEVDADQFRYPGPKPRTRESGIIMICDTVEAASRSLEVINEETLTALVDRLVADKASEGQFDQCQLTFEELSKVKKTLVKSLLLSQHTRVKYPKRP